jgi:3D (Asp-Asp-Asp) domain-containing protein
MRVASLAVIAAACSGDGTLEGPDAAIDAMADAARPPPGASRDGFDLTYYWVTAEADFAPTPTTTIYQPGCAALATVRSAFAASLDVEGTGRLVDGRLINVDGACGCARSPCYVVAPADHPWGTGVQDRALVPYRSLAVDRAVIPYGTPLWVAELDGVMVPGDPPWGGFVHDGCALAADTGGGIVGDHIDWFVGLRTSYQTLDAMLALDRVTVHDGGARCP